MLNSTEMLRLVRAACNGDHLKFAQQIELLADSAEKAKPTAYTTIYVGWRSRNARRDWLSMRVWYRLTG